jgi:hypothetical protein
MRGLPKVITVDNGPKFAGKVLDSLAKLGIMEVMVVGVPLEKGIGGLMLDAWGPGLNAAGLFPPLGSAALLAECEFIIGLDTGTNHLAAAQGVPCLALYGCREEPGRFFPMGNGYNVLSNSVSCAGCRLIEKLCPVVGHHCMSGIIVDKV